MIHARDLKTVTKAPVVTLPIVTAPSRETLAPEANVTKRTKPPGSGRPKTYATNAERQKAYRERLRAKG
jgi:hypothetical protein